MKTVDMHSPYSTKRTYLWRTPEEVAIAEQKYRFRADYKTEEEMAQDLRVANGKGVFDLEFATKILPLDEAKEMQDYAAQLKKNYPDVFPGGWVSLDPRKGIKALREINYHRASSVGL